MIMWKSYIIICQMWEQVCWNRAVFVSVYIFSLILLLKTTVMKMSDTWIGSDNSKQSTWFPDQVTRSCCPISTRTQSLIGISFLRNMTKIQRQIFFFYNQVRRIRWKEERHCFHSWIPQWCRTYEVFCHLKYFWTGPLKHILLYLFNMDSPQNVPDNKYHAWRMSQSILTEDTATEMQFADNVTWTASDRHNEIML